MSQDTLCRCRETPHSDVLNQHTPSSTSGKARIVEIRALGLIRGSCALADAKGSDVLAGIAQRIEVGGFAV